MNGKGFSFHNQSNGSALIAIVAAILLFSVLATALVSMVGSAEQQTAVSNLTDRAYYLAESGYRYAVARYRRPLTDDTDKYDALENMEGEHALRGNEGRFELKVYSFFYLTTADTTPGGNSLTVHAPGNFPKDEIDSADLDGQQVEIDGTLYTLGASSHAQEESDDLATFYVTTTLPTSVLPLGTMVFAATQTDTDQTLSSDGELSYKSGEAEMFPLRNGVIRLQSGSYLTYRVNDRAAHKFLGVRSAGGSDISGMSVPADTIVVLTPYARIHATGVAGGDGFEARREVIYSGGLPWSESSRRVPFEEKFETAENWDAVGSDTQTGVTDVGAGNQALQFTDSPGESEATLETEYTQANFDGFRTANGGYLSYDAQVKVGFFGTTQAPSATNPIPVDVAAGLSFRFNNMVIDGAGAITYNSYGLSFVKGDGSESVLNRILPTDGEGRTLTGQPLIVLWQQTGDNTTRQWLAYKKLPKDYFESFDDIDELGPGTWHNVSADDPPWQISPLGGGGCLRFSADNVGEGRVESPEIDLTSCSGGSEITLTFKSRDNVESDPHDRWVQVLTLNEDNSWTENNLVCSSDSQSACFIPPPADFIWLDAKVDLTAYGGKIIKIRFVQNNPSALSGGTGWYINDVAIQCEETLTVQDATLTVRLLEAAAVQFEGGGTTPIAMGNRIMGTVNGTMGTVIAPPIFSDAENTQGTLLLNNLTGSGFETGETIRVLSSADGAAATVAATTGTGDLKVNIIRAYYASAEGSGTEDDYGSPLDHFTRPYPRLGANDDLIWPVDDGQAWTSANDYFRLIQWDGVNSALSPDLEIIASTDTPNAVLRSYNTDLQSQFISAASPELGLHAYGGSSNVTKVYFDDFGYQLIMSPMDLYPNPFQQ